MFCKGEIPFVRMLVPLQGGILLGYHYSAEIVYNLIAPLTLGSLTLFAFLLFSYRRLSIYRFKWIAGLTIHFFLIAAGYWITVNVSGVYDKDHFRSKSADAYLALINNEPKVSGRASRFEVAIKQAYFQGENSVAKGKLIVSVQFDSAKVFNLKYGDLLLIPAAYDSIDPPYNPGEFNYKSYLRDHQIYYQAFVKRDQIYLVDRDNGNPLRLFALDLRKQLVEKFHRYLPDNNAAAFASTLILGYRAELSRELVEAYSKTGTMHVLSVSGMHVGIIFIVLTTVLRFMDRTKSTRLIRAFLIISIVWFYALITGFSAPACRAAVMLSFIVLGQALNKFQNTYNLIAISAFFLLLLNPFYLLDAGFQLSYLAVTGLVFFHPRIYQAIYIKNRLLDYVWSYSALSVAAQLATFPVSVYYFHQFPVYFLFSNLFIVFPVAIIMYGGIIFMFISFPVILYHCGIFLNWLINFTNNILYFIENLPFSSWDGIWLNTFEFALICIVILSGTLRLIYGNKKMMISISICIIILSTSFSLNWTRSYHQDQIVFYNLGRNTAFSYISKGESIIVSNVEFSDKILSFSILPAVKSLGSRRELFFREGVQFSGDSYAGDENFYQFASYRILKWDKNFNDVDFQGTLSVSAVLISDNPNVTLEKIVSCVKFSRIIMNSNNSEYNIRRWVAEAKKMELSYYVLKKNPALIVNL